jgi:chromosome segregation ATPase
VEIQLSSEVLTGIILSVLTLIGLVLALLSRMVRHMGSFSTALQAAADVNTVLNGQVRDMIAERRKDWALQEVERDTWDKERQALKKSVSDAQQAAEERLNNLTREHIRLQSALNAEKQARERGERESADKIATLQACIEEISAERDELRKERDDLRARVTELSLKVELLQKRDTGPLNSDVIKETVENTLPEQPPERGEQSTADPVGEG